MNKCSSSPVSQGSCLAGAPGGCRGEEFASLPALPLLDAFIALTISDCDLFSVSAICVTLWESCWGTHAEVTVGCQDLSRVGHARGTEAITGFMLL